MSGYKTGDIVEWQYDGETQYGVFLNYRGLSADGKLHANIFPLDDALIVETTKLKKSEVETPDEAEA